MSFFPLQLLFLFKEKAVSVAKSHFYFFIYPLFWLLISHEFLGRIKFNRNHVVYILSYPHCL
ncbi:hypothetical protein BD560DRAFT_409527 [Blakeslea trispora]|nr:hypothetical protein BD560DRAFT_409527 [Blakeslea trispora]